MFQSHKKGWIGVDVGTSTVKVVQLHRHNDRLQIAAKAIVPRREPWQTLSSSDPLSSTNELQAAAALLGDFKGRRTAATLSMALCDVHRIESLVSSSSRQAAAIRQTIEMATQNSADNWQYDCWSPKSLQEGSGGTNVLTALRTWTDQLCEDIAQLGWSCQLIDGLPLAMARAVRLVHPNSSGAPLAAIDLGYGAATFCTVVEGAATYVRSLKDCGFQRLLRVISEELNVTTGEAQRLFQEHGIAADPGSPLSDTAEILQELSDNYLSELVQEISRTLAHQKGQRQSVVPEQIYLLGGGATVKGLATQLTRTLQTNVEVWRFGDEPSGDALPTCLLGPAIALSALAWEQS